jgi:hypothetical protein
MGVQVVVEDRYEVFNVPEHLRCPSSALVGGSLSFVWSA